MNKIETNKKITAIIQLKENWDSFGGKPFSCDLMIKVQSTVDWIQGISGTVKSIEATCDHSVLIYFYTDEEIKVTNIEIWEDGIAIFDGSDKNIIEL